MFEFTALAESSWEKPLVCIFFFWQFIDHISFYAKTLVGSNLAGGCPKDSVIFYADPAKDYIQLTVHFSADLSSGHSSDSVIVYG
jgi:hypothetical protein